MVSELIKSYNLSKRSIDEIENFERYLLRRNELNTPTPYNLLISFSDPAEGSQFVEEFARIIHQMGNKENKRVCICSEEELSEHLNYLDKWLRNSHACLITADGSCDEEMWKIIQAYVSQTPRTVFVLSGLKEDIDQRFQVNDELYYRTFPYHIDLMEANSTAITSRFREMLEKNGFELSKRFAQEIEHYNCVVYPKADLRGDLYVRDLFRRVINNHLGSGKEGNYIEAESVPFYRKPDDKKTITNESAASHDNDIRRIPAIKPQQIHFDDLKTSKNVLLLSLSTLPPAEANYCIVEEAGDSIEYQLFSGYSQLEPGTKLFISKLALQGLKPDKIIVLTTEETLKPAEERGGKIAREVYAENVRRFIQDGDHVSDGLNEALRKQLSGQGYETARYVEISEKLHEVFPTRELQPSCESEWEQLAQYIDILSIPMGPNALQEIIKSITDLSESTSVNLFMDLQGGSRSFMFTMFATVTLLRGKNITIKDAFATRFHRDHLINPIETVLSEYAILDLVSGIRAFSRYGKVEELQSFLTTRDVPEGEREATLLKRLKHIDECMQINNPMGFTEEFDLIGSDPSMLDPAYYSDDQFKLIVEDLKFAYTPLLDPGHTILDQIQWMKEKSFLASALTFIEAKIPDYIVNNPQTSIITVDCLDYSDEEIQKKSGGHSYYSRQANLFNFELKHIIDTCENRLFGDICNLLADRILGKYKKNNNCITVRVPEKILNKVFEDEENKDALLTIERILGDEAWNDLTNQTICSWMNLNMVEYKQKIRRVVKRTETSLDTIGSKKKVSESEICRKDILSLEPDNKEKRNLIRLNALKQYLKNNEYTYDLNGQHSEKVELLLKNSIRHALFMILYDSGQNGSFYYQTIDQLLTPILDDGTVSLRHIKDGLESVENKWVFKEGFDRERCEYELWKELMTVYILQPEQLDIDLDKKVQEYVIMQKQVDDLEREMGKSDDLEETLGKPIESVSHNPKTPLVFAKNYIDCRNVKKDLRDNKKNRIQDRNCSSRNIDLYLQLGDVCRNICEKYFSVTAARTHRLSIAGVKKPESGWLGDIKIKEETEEYRDLLDTSICLYQALKLERNATNHAAENGDEHMEYRFTKKAISVFVELCRML